MQVAGDGLRHHAALAGAQFGRRRAGTTPRSRRCRASSPPCGSPNGVAVVADRFEQAHGGARCAQGHVEEGPRPPASTRKRRSTATTRRSTTIRTRKSQRCTPTGDAKAAFASAAKVHKAEFHSRLRLSCADGAAECGGALQRRRRQGRDLGRHAGARHLPDRGGQGARLQGGAGHRAPVLHRRRLRPAQWPATRRSRRRRSRARFAAR